MTKKLYSVIFIVISLFIVIGLSGCEDSSRSESFSYKDQKYTKYDNYTEKYVSPRDKMKTLEREYKNYSEEVVTDLAFELEKSQIKYLNYYNDKIYYDGNHKKVYEYFKDGFSREVVERIDDTEFKSLMEEIIDSNYTLKLVNDMYDVVIDYEGFDKYYLYMSTEGRSYFYIKEREYLSPWEENGELAVELYDLGDRIVEADDFILKYPFSKRINEILMLNTKRVWNILVGTEKNSISDDDGNVKGNYRSLYRYLASRLSNKGFSGFLRGYIALLESQEYRYDDVALNYIHTYDYFYNFDIPNYDKEKIIIDYMDGSRFGGNYNYPRITGYSNKEKEGYFNKKLLELVEERLNYDVHKGYYVGKIEYWSNYMLSYNEDGIVCFKIYIDYEYKDKGRVDYLTRGMTVDFKSGEIITLKDIFPLMDEEHNLIYDRIKEFTENSDYRDLIDLRDFNSLMGFDYILNDGSVDLLYDVYSEDNNNVRTIRIPIDFDGLTINLVD